MRANYRTLASIFTFCAVGVSEASGKDYNRMGKIGFAQWQCAALGQIANEDDKAADVGALFESGYRILSELVTDAVAGLLTKENSNEIPIGISMWLTGGPSIDFRMGFMWAQFVEDAYDETWPDIKDATFDQQSELQAMNARNRFRSGNCHLLN